MPAENLSPAQELVALRASAATTAAELTAASDLLAEAQAQVSALTGERDAAKAEASRLSGELATASASLTGVTAERNAYAAAFPAGGHFAFADGKVGLTEAGRIAHINAAVTQTVAAAGHAPLPTVAAGGTVDTGAQASAPKLTGRDRLKAETRKEFAAKTAVTITV